MREARVAPQVTCSLGWAMAPFTEMEPLRQDQELGHVGLEEGRCRFELAG